jgi:hypothetical protein
MKSHSSKAIAPIVLTLLCAAILAVSPSLEAQKVVRPRAGAPGEWRVIGTVTANFTADHDALVVAGPFDNFRKIKFKVTGAALNLQRLVVVYDNGEPDKIDVRQNIPEGGESRQIDLRGIGQRSVRRIDFWYDTKGIMRGKASVTVVGQK